MKIKWQYLSRRDVQRGAQMGEEEQSGNNVGDCGRMVWVVREWHLQATAFLYCKTTDFYVLRFLSIPSDPSLFSLIVKKVADGVACGNIMREEISP